MGHLGYKCMEDWYSVTVEDIRKNGGAGLLEGYYHNSPSAALQSIYSEHNWELEKFKNKPTQLRSIKNQRLYLKNRKLSKKVTNIAKSKYIELWKSKENQQQFCNDLMTQLGYKIMADWYHVSKKDFYKNGGQVLLSKHYNNSPLEALQSIYPQHLWEQEKFYKQGNFGEL